MTSIRRILAVMLGAVALALMILAAVILALAILSVILRTTISTSILSNRPPRRDAPRPMRIDSQRSRQR
ncbi:hypothetical protein DF034_17465 [Burkholderia anthina]|nr:hypothetical protein DF034_17465 [Burkholderia anthina]